MATKKEIKENLKIALKEIGDIKPWYDDEVQAWFFSHELYPVEYAGKTSKEVIKNYPIYLKDFIAERLQDNIAGFVEKATKGRGGKREGAGRPKGSTKEKTIQVRIPTDIAKWLKTPGVISDIRHMISSYKHV